MNNRINLLIAVTLIVIKTVINSLENKVGTDPEPYVESLISWIWQDTHWVIIKNKMFSAKFSKSDLQNNFRQKWTEGTYFIN